MKHALPLLSLCLTPAFALAHPGHFDDSAIAHTLSHGLFYVLGVAALYLLAKEHGPRIRRAIIAKGRRR